jgi:AcrR family transcriptional regulator
MIDEGHPLSRERVISAGVVFADTHGIHKLSMRRLAGAVGVEAMSLYNHVSNKDDLIDGMIDAVIGEITLPRPGNPWKDEMRARAESAHAVLMKHRWAAVTLLSRLTTGPNMIRYIDATIGCLREAGFPWSICDHAWNAMDNHIYGFSLQLLNMPYEPDEYSDAAAEFLAEFPTEQFPYFHELSSQVIEKTHSGVNELGFGLNLILEGLEKYREKERRES